jgi:hypothetical protein
MVETFLEAVSAEVLQSEPAVSVAELLRRYFGAEAPFSGKKGRQDDSEKTKEDEGGKAAPGEKEKGRKGEGKKAKKSEFPDAIALLSLEAWALDADTTVLVPKPGLRGLTSGRVRLVVFRSDRLVQGPDQATPPSDRSTWRRCSATGSER